MKQCRETKFSFKSRALAT